MKKRYAISALVAASLIGGGVAYATIPDSNTGVFTGCRLNATGSLRLIDAQAGATCTGAETQVQWNQTGPQGSPGLSGLQIVDNQADLEPNSIWQPLCVTAPAGKKIISGGFQIGLGDADFAAAQNAKVTQNLGAGGDFTQWCIQVLVSNAPVHVTVVGYAANVN